MSKKLIFIVIGALLLVAGGVGGYMYFTNSEATEETDKKEKEKVWNPYSTKEKHIKTLNDFLISAANGEYTTKMTVSIDLKDEEAVKKFEGEESPEVKEEGGKGHGSSGGDEAHLSPMEVEINSLIGTFMLNTKEETLKDKETLEKEMMKFLNNKLDLGDHFIHKVLIENYVIQ